MEKEKLMALLRNPKKHQKQPVRAVQNPIKEAEKVQKRKAEDRIITVVTGVMVVLVLISLVFIFSAQNRANNVSSSLDPSTLKGLVVDSTFSPTSGKRYVQVGVGQERSVSASQLGTVLPVIRRDNYRALTPDNYRVIGAAPWALTTNVSSNLEDPDLLRFLFNQEKTIEGFLKRADVAALLADPAELAKVAQNEQALKTFFGNETVKQVLDSPQLLNALAGSRLFAYLLISKAGKYYRDHPTEAVRLLHASPTLTALKQNPNVRQEVERNIYLKNISATLLK